MQRKIERMTGLAGKKCSMLQGLQAGYTQCFDICCRLLRRLCLLFSVRILYPQLCGRRKAANSQRHSMAGFLLLLTGTIAAGFFFLLSKGTAWAVKIGSESGAIKDQVNIAFENGCCRAEELLGRERGEIRTFFQDKGDEMAKTVGREILPKAADWTAKSCSFALRTGAFWGIGMIAAFWLCRDYAAFFGMDEKERDLGKY